MKEKQSEELVQSSAQGKQEPEEKSRPETSTDQERLTESESKVDVADSSTYDITEGMMKFIEEATLLGEEETEEDSEEEEESEDEDAVELLQVEPSYNQLTNADVTGISKKIETFAEALYRLDTTTQIIQLAQPTTEEQNVQANRSASQLEKPKIKDANSEVGEGNGAKSVSNDHHPKTGQHTSLANGVSNSDSVTETKTAHTIEDTDEKLAQSERVKELKSKADRVAKSIKALGVGGAFDAIAKSVEVSAEKKLSILTSALANPKDISNHIEELSEHLAEDRKQTAALPESDWKRDLEKANAVLAADMKQIKSVIKENANPQKSQVNGIAQPSDVTKSIVDPRIRERLSRTVSKQLSSNMTDLYMPYLLKACKALDTSRMNLLNWVKIIASEKEKLRPEMMLLAFQLANLARALCLPKLDEVSKTFETTDHRPNCYMSQAAFLLTAQDIQKTVSPVSIPLIVLHPALVMPSSLFWSCHSAHLGRSCCSKKFCGSQNSLLSQSPCEVLSWTGSCFAWAERRGFFPVFQHSVPKIYDKLVIETSRQAMTQLPVSLEHISIAITRSKVVF